MPLIHEPRRILRTHKCEGSANASSVGGLSVPCVKVSAILRPSWLEQKIISLRCSNYRCMIERRLRIRCFAV